MNAEIRPDQDWKSADSYHQQWAARSVAALPLLKGKAIADVGCGAPQNLKAMLPRGVLYYPADLEAWTPDTEVCDLSNGIFPTRSLAACDTAVVLGVLEYIEDIENALKGLLQAPALVVSYHFGGQRHPAWRSNISYEDFRKILSKSGYFITRRIKFRDQSIVRAVRGPRAFLEVIGLL